MVLYTPREDSHLLAKYVEKHAKGAVLDVGTGSGIQALIASKRKEVRSVLGVDIQKSVVEHCRKRFAGESRKLSFRQSDLFGNVKGKFDTIVFNPPYLPDDGMPHDPTVIGGVKGYEVLELFFNHVNAHLNQEGIVLVLFSSYTKKQKVEGLIANNLLEFRELGKKKLFMEELYVYDVNKSSELKMLEKKGLLGLKRFAKGHRGQIITGMLGRKRIAVKMQRKDIEAKGTVDREAKMLRLLNKQGIGPKLLFSGKDYFAYEFVEGIFIPEFIEISGRKDILKVIENVFIQCYKLDKLGINKEEMHRPYKHIIVVRGRKKKAVLLDFERAKRSAKVHNVTQFCQYIASGRFSRLAGSKISIDRSRIMLLAKDYKENLSRKKLGNIISYIRSP